MKKWWHRVRQGLRELWHGWQAPTHIYVLNVDDIKMPDEYTIDDMSRVLPFSDPAQYIKYVQNNPDEVYPYIFDRLKDAIARSISPLILYRLKYTSRQIQLSQINYTVQLDILQRYFVSKEDYERAEECQQLQIQNQLNRVPTS